MTKRNWKKGGWIAAAALTSLLLLGSLLGAYAYLGRWLLLKPPNLPVVTPYHVEEEEKIEWQNWYWSPYGESYTMELDSAVEVDGRRYYAIPRDRHDIADTTGGALAYTDYGFTGLEAAFSRGYLYRVRYDPKGDFLYQPAFRDGTMYATREAAERYAAPDKKLTGIHVGYEADALITEPADMETLQRLETIQGKTVRYKLEGSAAYSYSLSCLYNDLPLLHSVATIARVDGQFIYVKTPGTAVRYETPVSSPTSSMGSRNDYEGMVIEDPDMVQALLDIRVNGKSVFSLKGRQGTAL